MRYAVALLAVLVTTLAIAQDDPSTKQLHYMAHIQLTAGSSVAIDQAIELVDRREFAMQGTAPHDPKVKYILKMTPYLASDGRIGLNIDSLVTTQGPTSSITAGGKTLALPSSTTCSFAPKAFFSYDTPQKIAGTVPGCQITVTLSKPRSEAQ